MTIRLWNKIATNLNHCLYPPPELPAGPKYHVPFQDGKVLLDSGNDWCVIGMSASIGSCFNGAQGSIFYWIKIGAAGSRQLLRNVITKNTNSAISQATHRHISSDLGHSWARTTYCSFWKWHKDSFSTTQFLDSKWAPEVRNREIFKIFDIIKCSTFHFDGEIQPSQLR